jgi:integrase
VVLFVWWCKRRRLKTTGSERHVPITDELASVLERHSTTTSTAPLDPVFPGDLGVYERAYETFRTAVRRAGLQHASLHDLRHTFGVHCAQAGVPLPRLQKMLGHSSPVMTMRYMKHDPRNYFADDATRLSANLRGAPANATSLAATRMRIG